MIVLLAPRRSGEDEDVGSPKTQGSTCSDLLATLGHDAAIAAYSSAEMEVKNFDHVVLFSDASMPMRRPFRKRKEALEHRRRIEAEALLPITLHFASTATNA